MITFEERWRINRKRRKQGKPDIQIRITDRCKFCNTNVSNAMPHNCNGTSRSFSLFDSYEKISIRY